MDVLEIVMTVIGAVIGAGFASGRELVGFFGWTPDWRIALVVGVCFFAITAAYLLLGSSKRKSGKMFNELFSLLSFFNSIVTLAVMLAGTDALLRDVTGLSFPFSLVMGLISVVVVSLGRRGLVGANLLLAPSLVVIIALICLLTINSPSFLTEDAQGISNAFSYCSMNMLLAAPILLESGVTNKRKILTIATLIGVLLGGLVMLFFFAFCSFDASGAEMPLLAMASTHSPIMYAVAALAIGVGIFTTMISSHSVLVSAVEKAIPHCSKPLAALATLSACYIVSTLGFGAAIDVLYPILGVLSVVAVVFAVSFVAIEIICNALKVFRAKRQVNTLPRQADKVRRWRS